MKEMEIALGREVCEFCGSECDIYGQCDCDDFIINRERKWRK